MRQRPVPWGGGRRAGSRLSQAEPPAPPAAWPWAPPGGRAQVLPIPAPPPAKGGVPVLPEGHAAGRPIRSG